MDEVKLVAYQFPFAIRKSKTFKIILQIAQIFDTLFLITILCGHLSFITQNILCITVLYVC